MQVKPTVKHGQVTESCYQMDMGKDGEIPRNRRVWYKTGMSSTTLDLFDGTTKATYQVSSLLEMSPQGIVVMRVFCFLLVCPSTLAFVPQRGGGSDSLDGSMAFDHPILSRRSRNSFG